MSPEERGHKRCINLSAIRKSKEDRQYSGVHVDREWACGRLCVRDTVTINDGVHGPPRAYA